MATNRGAMDQPVQPRGGKVPKNAPYLEKDNSSKAQKKGKNKKAGKKQKALAKSMPFSRKVSV